MGGGGFTSSGADVSLDRYVAALPRVERPRMCLLPTASGDPEEQIARFFRAFDGLAELSHVSLFRLGTNPVPLREHLLAQDLIYVGGGSMVNLIAIWRAHGLDVTLREAWEQGTVLAGVSAGAMCWFEAGITRSHGGPVSAPALRLLPGSASVHRDSDPQRKDVYESSIRGGVSGGYAIDDGVGLLFDGTELKEAVSARTGSGACRMHLGPGESPQETELEVRVLTPPAEHDGSTPTAIAEFRAMRRLTQPGAGGRARGHRG